MLHNCYILRGYMILVIGGIKGGSGKTTLATNLAVLRSKKKKVLLIDGDNQRSSIEWADQRQQFDGFEISKFDVVSLVGAASYKTLNKLSKDYDDIIIDTGGRDTDSQRSMLLEADVYLLPFRPRSLDIWTIGAVTRILEDVKKLNPKLKTLSMINQADSRGSDNNDAKGILQDLKEFRYIDTPVGYRKAFSKAIDDGLGVVELEMQDEKASLEIKKLYETIYRL